MDDTTMSDEINMSSGSNGKRQKIDHDNVVEGSIVKVELKNFMTFSKVTYTPKPKLNLIIGPNGSGKSSIVTALILGFGGSPKDINRGDKVSQFVKTGQSTADISIELYKKSNQNINLRRTIFAEKENSHFYVNNVMVSKKRYDDAVSSLNIKVHNLCQFLPQDRLEDFSKLDSKGLLLNALQSIENKDLLENFEKLKFLANSMTTFDTDKKKLQNTIRLETASNLKLETIVTSFTEKKSLENKLLVVLQKRSWSGYVLTWNVIKDELSKFESAKKHNLNALSIIKDYSCVINRNKKRATTLKTFVLKKTNILCKLLDKINEKFEISESHVSAIKDLVKTERNISTQIQDLKDSILSMEEKLESIKSEALNVEACKQELNDINKKIKDIDENINPVNINLDHIKNKLKGLSLKIYAIDQDMERENRKEDSKNQLLQRRFPEMWKAIQWLRNCDKKSIFHGEVYEPLFTQIKVLDLQNSKYIENIVNYRDMIAFVFEYAEDLTVFNKIVERERWQKINSISAPPANFKIQEEPNYNINSLVKFGFHAYALDLIHTPLIIKRYLMKNYDMHNIPIGSKEVINNMDNLPNGIRLFFAGNDQISIKTSIYSGEKITRQNQISTEAQFLLFSVDSNLIQTLNIKKEEIIKECDNFELQQSELINQLKVIENSRQPCISRKREIQGIFIKFQNRQNAFNKMEKDIQFTRSELKREEGKLNELKNNYLKLIDKYFASMNEVNKMLENYGTLLMKLLASAFIVNNHSHCAENDIKVFNQLKALYASNLDNFNLYLKYIQQLESELSKMEEVALHWSKGVSPYDKKLFVPMKEKFEQIEENEIEELDGLIVEYKAKLNCINVDPNTPQLIKEYKERKLKIKDLEKKLEILDSNTQSKEAQIETLHSEWFPAVKELSCLLSSNFQKFIGSFGCNGIIELDIGVTRYDFESYGLLLKVQFRDDNSSLRLLDAKSQSGGERALTTALFLLSLQEVTHFPFRIVDEINQGMDKVYERKLMELFMELFEKRNNQYLVVTPKLIKNLSFRNTTVDIICCNKNIKEV